MIESLDSQPKETPDHVDATQNTPDIVSVHAREWQRLVAIGECLSNTVGNQSLIPSLEHDLRDDLQTDHYLQTTVTQLRALFLKEIGNFTSKSWLTPHTGESVAFPGTDETYRFCYDRQHSSELLENRMLTDKLKTKRFKYGLLCGNGMAAINTIMQSLAHLISPKYRRLGVFACYLETHSLLRMSSFKDSWVRIAEPESLVDGVMDSSFDILFIEPVQYNWSLTTVPWDALITAINKSDKPPIIIMDTTLSGQTDEWVGLHEKLLKTVCPLIVRVRSGLKLDQEGLELGNLGILEWWPREDLQESFERLSHLTDTFRTISGANLGRAASCALSPPFVMDLTGFKRYSKGIFRSNRELYKALNLKGDLFVSKVYPKPPWDSAFVLLSLREGTGEDYTRLAYLINKEALRREMHWTMSGSFGFRSEHFETILPCEQIRYQEAPSGVLKIAAGRYRGARFWAIVELLNELASFDTLDDVEKFWSKRQVFSR